MNGIRIGSDKTLWSPLTAVEGFLQPLLVKAIAIGLSLRQNTAKHEGSSYRSYRSLYRAVVLALAFIFSAGLFSLLFAETDNKGAELDPELLLLQKPPMRVAIVRDDEPGCEPDCTEWISAEGVIMPETPLQFEKTLNELGARKLPVFINSPGGVVGAGLAIGRMIRAHQLDVAVSKTVFKSCSGTVKSCAKASSAIVYGAPQSSGAFCASACTFILAGGRRRFVAPWAKVGVHQITTYEKRVQKILTFKTTTTFTAPGSEPATHQSLVGEKEESNIVKLDVPKPETLRSIGAYFREMGIGDELQNLANATKPESLHWLNYAELVATHIATDYRGSEYLAALTSQRDQIDADKTSFSYGILRMASFTGRPVFILLEFYHRVGAPNVDVFAFLSDRDQFVAAANFALALQLGLAKQSPEVEVISARPFAPMNASFLGSLLCADQPNADAKLTLIQITKGARLAGPAVAMDLHQLDGMNEFVTTLCDQNHR